MASNYPNGEFPIDFFDDLLAENVDPPVYIDMPSFQEDPLLADLLNQIHTSPQQDPLPTHTDSHSQNSSTPHGDSPDAHYYSNFSEPSPGGLSNFSTNSELDERIKIIAEPFYGNKLRYRSDFQANQNRLGTLKNRTKNSNYQGPAIRIPQKYLYNGAQMRIQVTLVTALHPRSNLRYTHPYQLENVGDSAANYSENNSIWFPIREEDQTGIKSFPSLRIVKKTATELRNTQSLRSFNHNGETWTEQVQTNHVATLASPSPKRLIKEYYLEHTHLAFTLCELVSLDDISVGYKPLWHTTAFSQAMVEQAGADAEGDQEVQVPSENATGTSSNCRILRYAPHYGFATTTTEMIVVLTDKLELRKYGEVKVALQCTACNPTWNFEVKDITKKDRLIFFNMPEFPWQIEDMVKVDVFITQASRSLGQCQYYYLPSTGQCFRCQFGSLAQCGVVLADSPNKRPRPDSDPDEIQNDAIVPKSTNAPELHHSNSNPTTSALVNSSASKPAANNSSSSSLPKLKAEVLTNKEQLDHLMDKLCQMTNALFRNRDEKPLLLICRPFIKECPEIAHDALAHRSNDLLIKYLPLAALAVLQYRFEGRETFLLHAIRLNRLEVVRVLCESRKAGDFEKIIEDLDDHGNNLFHLLASDPSRIDLLDLIIKQIEERHIPVGKLFDRVNNEGLTPLQTAIRQNNRQAVQRLLKYFRTDVYYSANTSGDNLLHLAVRHGDLDLVKYLIEEGKLLQQGEQSNLTQTPVDLARSLDRTEMIDYFRTLYPQLHRMDESESSESDSGDDDDGRENVNDHSATPLVADLAALALMNTHPD